VRESERERERESERERFCLKGEVDGHAVGLCCLSSTVDLGVLAQCFELAPYGQLRKQPEGGAEDLSAECLSGSGRTIEERDDAAAGDESFAEAPTVEHEVVGGKGEGEGEGAVVSACMHTCARMSTKTKSGRSSSAAISSELASACSTFPHSSVRKLSARSTRSALCSGVEHALISRNAFTVRR
jgi:hypothetical protein